MHMHSEDFLAARLHWEVARLQINQKQGGLLVNGIRYRIAEFVFRDNENDLMRQKELLEKMLNPESDEFADLDFVLGPIGSRMTKVALEVAARYQKVLNEAFYRITGKMPRTRLTWARPLKYF